MPEKDIAEKSLEAYNDVFADIVNVLLFDGRQLVREDELTDSQPLSQYKADGLLHEQERDVSKFWNRSNVRISLYGIENQTDIDADMPLRVMGYDGASYREQLLGARKERYPVVTLVLYFGKRPWKRPVRLHDCFEVSEELKPYVSDYRLNVFDIPRMDPEKVKLFRSDFRIIADYFVQQEQTDDYKPSQETIDHVHEMLELMSVLTKDDRFLYAVNTRREGGMENMCEILDRGEARGEARGISIGEARGMQNAKINNAKAFLKEGLPADMIARCIGLPLEQVRELEKQSS